MYDFVLVDGTLSAKDLTFFIKKNDIAGVIFDLARSTSVNFDYATIESIKNAYLSSGKYSGKARFLSDFKVVVFSNSRPVTAALSEDRWRVEVVGEGLLANSSVTPSLIATNQYPPKVPKPLPFLGEGFDYKLFLANPVGCRSIQNTTAVPFISSQLSTPPSQILSTPTDAIFRISHEDTNTEPVESTNPVN